MSDLRQRFYIEDSPVRGEVVHLEETLQTILAQRDYAPAVQVLLGEMLSATALLASTLKIKGRISLQIQASGSFKWAMAECNHLGEVRALADYEADPRFNAADSSSTVLSTLISPVLFINIEPEFGERYQGIVALDKPNLAGCLMQYYDLSAQIPTRIVLASSAQRAGGLLIQLLPRNSEEEQERVDQDLWPRLTMLTETLKPEELTDLPANEILYRLYNEEEVRLPDVEQLKFGCTCSKARCANALIQIGVDAVHETLEAQNPIQMDCQFCNTRYEFTAEEALALLADEAEDVAHALSDDELDYLPLLPDDTHTLADRVQALADWCAGVVLGFGLASGHIRPDEMELIEHLQDVAAVEFEETDDDEEGEESYQELYEFVRLIPVSLSVGRKKIAVEESSLLKHFHNKQQIDRSVTEANNVVEMFTPHRPS